MEETAAVAPSSSFGIAANLEQQQAELEAFEQEQQQQTELDTFEQEQQQMMEEVIPDIESYTDAAMVPLVQEHEANLATEWTSVAPLFDDADLMWEQETTASFAYPVQVQGGALRTWTFEEKSDKRAIIMLETSGMALDAHIDLWQGPKSTPQMMRVYSDNGKLRPFRALVETPRSSNTIAIRNTGELEFPLSASIQSTEHGAAEVAEATTAMTHVGNDKREKPGRKIEGKSVYSYPFDSSVKNVKILLKTDGRPLNARIEIMQGPNLGKQVIDLYTEDGTYRPFSAVIEIPGSGNVVRIVNTAPAQFPLTAWVEPYVMESTVFRPKPHPRLGGTCDNSHFLFDRPSMVKQERAKLGYFDFGN